MGVKTTEGACCAPGQGAVGGTGADVGPTLAATVVDNCARSTKGQVRLPGGAFAMGDPFNEGYASDGETPVHQIVIPPMWMDRTSVTNAQFATFAKASGYVTDAERFGSSAVFHLEVAASHEDVLGRATDTPWWIEVRGANWRHPEGPLSDISRRQNHPVVHVSWNDANAYADWVGKRLPTEAEWEYAARGGLAGARYPWGDELKPRGKWLCNIWQGAFPAVNTREDGYSSTAPAKSFYENKFGLWQMVGNVWEWCADWFSSSAYADRAAAVTDSQVTNPRGPQSGQARVMRGGSFLCHDTYCCRYRVAARSSNTPESSSSNIGFRCANDDKLARATVTATMPRKPSKVRVARQE